jgi:hypothetical protein
VILHRGVFFRSAAELVGRISKIIWGVFRTRGLLRKVPGTLVTSVVMPQLIEAGQKTAVIFRPLKNDIAMSKSPYQ